MTLLNDIIVSYKNSIQSGKLAKRRVDKMVSWQNGKLAKWQVDKMTK
jgi:hypothetical protein